MTTKEMKAMEKSQHQIWSEKIMAEYRKWSKYEERKPGAYRKMMEEKKAKEEEEAKKSGK